VEVFKDITFPVYRKYKNGLSVFRINSADSFDEIRMMGTRYLHSRHEVKTLPERNFVYDLVINYEAYAENISAETFEAALHRAEAQ
jgi:hypothetical protein